MNKKKIIRTAPDPDQIRSANRLKELIKAKNAAVPGEYTQEQIGAKFWSGRGITQGAVGQYLNGRTVMGTDVCIEFARILDIDVSEFAPTNVIKKIQHMLTVDDEFFDIHYHATYHKNEKLRFRYSWALELGLSYEQTKNLVAVIINDSKMEPNLLINETLLVRSDIVGLESGGVYAISKNGVDIMVRRLYKHDSILIIVSDNPDVKIGPEIIDEENLTIVGKAFYRSGSIK